MKIGGDEASLSTDLLLIYSSQTTKFVAELPRLAYQSAVRLCLKESPENGCKPMAG